MNTSTFRGLTASFILSITQLTHGQALPPASARGDAPAYAPGEVLVQFKSTVTDAEVNAAFQGAGLGLIRQIQTPAMQDRGLIGLTRAATTMPVETAVRILRSLSGVEFAEPNWVYTHQDTFPPNDFYFLNGSLWGMYGDVDPFSQPSTSRVNLYGSRAAEAWGAGYTGSGTVFVGVIDTGIQFTHPDLAANIWTNPYDPVDGIDNDGNGYVDDIHGWDFVFNDNSIYDGTADAHGTHVAGTIGAAGGNELGVVGVNWDVTVISGKFLGPNGGTTADAIEAVDYFTDLKQNHGVNIVALNNSWGGGGFSQALLDAIVRAAQQDILFIAAAGNGASDNDTTAFYPACYDTTVEAGFNSVIAVASIQSDGALASSSNYGNNTVHLAAPGVGVLSTVPYATPTVMVGEDSYSAGQIHNAAAGTISAELVDGGKALSADANWAGKVVLVERGEATFFTKVMNVQNAGGVAAVIYNNIPGGFDGSLTPTSAIPAVSITREDGLLLQTKLGLSTTIDSPVPGTPGSSYAHSSGTSMATPHVTGAVALYASTHPGSTPEQTRYDLLNSGVRPLTVLQGITVTGGTLDIGTLMEVPANNLPAPIAPDNVQATIGLSGRVDVTWIDQSNNELGFAIERSTDGVTYAPVATVGANLVSYADRTVKPNTTYLYRVRAYNPGGNSAYVVAAGAVTVPNVTLPAAPSNLTAKTQIGAVNLAWADKSSNEEGFLVERKAGKGSWQVVATVSANISKYTDATTVSRTKYTYRVRAHNIAGSSGSSNEVSVTGK